MLATVLPTLLLVASVSSDWDSECHGCDCKWVSGKKLANCTNAGLTSVPLNLHPEVQVLILDYNQIARLGENVFITKLPNLQKISLRHCGIKTIHESAFNNLKILVEIDLSYNNVTKFGTKTFSGNNRLKTLNLSYNVGLKSLEPYQFPSLPYLKSLDFSYCSLRRVERSAFGNISLSSLPFSYY
jgi:Leucine-rich repeat (LRR) protein